jgi:cyclic pyranopterin phosphate synthase
MELSHVGKQGEARMVDVSGKEVVHRQAVAFGCIYLKPETIALIRENQIKKGDVLAAARLAGIMGAKKTVDLIPLCHNIPINSIEVWFDIKDDRIDIRSKAVCEARTGIEMEALTAVAVAGLTIYDMCKAVDKGMRISEIKLEEKRKEKRGAVR